MMWRRLELSRESITQSHERKVVSSINSREEREREKEERGEKTKLRKGESSRPEGEKIQFELRPAAMQLALETAVGV